LDYRKQSFASKCPPRKAGVPKYNFGTRGKVTGKKAGGGCSHPAIFDLNKYLIT